MTPTPRRAPDAALVGLNKLATVARLLSGAAHEVNNALQVISGTVEVLEMRGDLPRDVSEALARLRAQGVRAAGALHRVNAFTRAEEGAGGPVNLRELAEESLALREFAIRRARLSARLVADDGTVYVVSGNRGDLQQVLLNLIINAEAALARRTGTIVVRLQRDDDFVTVTVEDDGPGIAIDSEQAFEPFVTGGDPFDTAGLGLWVGRLLAARHGGTLTLGESRTGTALVMRLPAARRR